MNYWILAATLLMPVAVSVAEDDAPTPDRPPPATSQPAGFPQGANVMERIDPPSTGALDAGSGDEAVRVTPEARWLIAGYNNNEIVYTISVLNQDTRIIRCTTLIKGAFLENGKKIDISDRQSTTVFPAQTAQVGNWIGMDEQSGATYRMKCRPL